MGSSKQKSTSKNSKKNNQQEPTLEEIEEILREEVPTVLQNFITDTKYVFTGKDKYNRELILPYSVPTQVAIGGSAGYLTGLIGKKIWENSTSLSRSSGSNDTDGRTFRLFENKLEKS